jgi:hypothetical protein
MSDRAKGSVRTGAGSDGATASDETPKEEPSVTSTQSIPGTSTQRAQAAAAGAEAPAPASHAQAPHAQAPNAPASHAAVPPAPVPPVPVPLAQGAATGARPIPGMGPATGAGPMTGAAAPGAGAPMVGARDARGKSSGRAGRGPRRARLQLRHIDTWSAFKISFVLSIAMFCIWMVAVGVLYGVLNGLGVFDTLNDLFGQVGGTKAGQPVKPVITLGVVFWGAGIIGAINIVLMTALCTVGTFIYNMCSDLVGGLEITLSERD